LLGTHGTRAAFIGCRADSIVTLPNGATLDLILLINTTAGSLVSDGGSYLQHPAGDTYGPAQVLPPVEL
jgi:hypothetical protein